MSQGSSAVRPKNGLYLFTFSVELLASEHPGVHISIGDPISPEHKFLCP